jgi:hypothetical protein
MKKETEIIHHHQAPSSLVAKGKNEKGKQKSSTTIKPHQALTPKVRTEKETKSIHRHQAIEIFRRGKKFFYINSR